MKIEEREKKTLQVMFARTDREPLRCGFLGDRVFDDVKRHRGSAPFARIQGKIMRRLEAKGLVYYSHASKFGGWRLSSAGLSLMEEQQVNVTV